MLEMEGLFYELTQNINRDCKYFKLFNNYLS